MWKKCRVQTNEGQREIKLFSKVAFTYEKLSTTHPHTHSPLHTCTIGEERGESRILYGLSQCQMQVHGERVLLCTASEKLR